jgi:hypothetical protein
MGGSQFEARLDKKFVRPHLIQQKLGIVVHTSHSSYMESINQKISVQASLGINHKTPFKK